MPRTAPAPRPSEAGQAAFLEVRPQARAPARESGQASVEAVATVPLVVLAALIAWQLVLAGHTLWLCANAARAAARAELVGKSPARAARSALPRSLERGLHVERRDGGQVRVAARVPIVLSAWSSPVRVAATASLGGGG